ncbi:hypothetical protein U1872_01240 [Sphingomonas sp. RB3P16]|uniref:hypothetical protein n=1 Tax=Parasphingomonas frigoris TaxID=3096163 RepID=UPI002FCAF4E2
MRFHSRSAAALASGSMARSKPCRTPILARRAATGRVTPRWRGSPARRDAPL